jgi:hypothetical protein
MIARIVANIGVELTTVAVTELPIVRMPRKVSIRVIPGTKSPISTKRRLAGTRIGASGLRIKQSNDRKTVLTAIVIQTPHGVGRRRSPLWARRPAEAKQKAVSRLSRMASTGRVQFLSRRILIKVPSYNRDLVKIHSCL